MKHKKSFIYLLFGLMTLCLSLALARPVAAADHTINFDQQITWTNGDCGIMSSEAMASERKALDKSGKKTQDITVYSRQKLIVTGSDQASGKELYRMTADTVDGVTNKQGSAKYFSLKDVPQKYGKYEVVGQIPEKLTSPINFKNESGISFYHVQYRLANGSDSKSGAKLQSQKAKSKVSKERGPFKLFIIPDQNAGMIMLGFIGACVAIALGFAIRIIIDIRK